MLTCVENGGPCSAKLQNLRGAEVKMQTNRGNWQESVRTIGFSAGVLIASLQHVDFAGTPQSLQLISWRL